MADPKYADLPGIAHDEPDVYESTDLPESEQAADFYEDEDDPVERIHISTDQAYDKFKGKFLDAGNVDFSSRVGRRIRTGYDARTGDWELVPVGERESPVQKYNRLKCEMRELLEEVRELKVSESGEVDCLVSAEQVERSLGTLLELKLEATLGEGVVSKLSDPQGAQIKKLVSQLDQYKASIHEKPESESQTATDGIVYQFTYRPEQARFSQTTRLAELEARLNRLESVVGVPSDKLSRLTAATSKATLYETAEHLCATLSLLDSTQLDHVEGRLMALSQKMETIAENKKHAQLDEEKDKMILELYDLVKNSEQAVHLLPKTIERLKALEELHKKAADFTKTLTQIEAVQSEIAGNIQDNKTLLQGVQESFAMSLNEINSTVVSLDSRIKALKKK